MLGLSLWKLVVLGGVVTLMFGRGKVSELMGDVAKGIKGFRREMSDDADRDTAAVQVTTGADKPALRQ